MTREEILAMEPGRELDALVAQKVMGWYEKSEGVWVSPVGFDDPHHYSTDISAAWEVEEKIKELRLHVPYVQGLKEVVLSTGEYVGLFDYIYATPEQRCKAALLAVLEGVK